MFLILSCTKKHDLDGEDLLGEWTTREMFVNGDDSGIPFTTEGLVIMGFHDDYFFYNFQRGDWKVEADKITLYSGDEIYRVYDILYLNADSLVIETTLAEVEIFFDVESIASDEIVTLTEHLTKQ